MFERFSDSARRAVGLANEEARELGHSYIGTEHILLGLLREADGAGAKALIALGVNLEEARGAIETIIGRGVTLPEGHIPFTPRAKKILEYGLREALQLGSKHIGTEHMLLGLLQEGDGVGAQVLLKMGVDVNTARSKVAELGNFDPESPDRSLPRRPKSARCQHPEDTLVVGAVQDFRTVRCSKCGTLIGVLPSA